jgi:hypothetical protein
MDLPYSLPELCRETGLTCESCTRESARNTARICGGLPAKALGQLFVELYPHPACAPMHGHFADCYRERVSEETPRREVAGLGTVGAFAAA